MIHRTGTAILFILLFTCCREKKPFFRYPVTVSISRYVGPDSPFSSGAYLVHIKNDSLPYILIKRYQDGPNEPYYLPTNLFMLSGKLDHLHFYMGPVSIPERLPAESIDTIYSGEKSTYFLDYKYHFTDSSDFVLLPLSIVAPYFDSLNNLPPFEIRSSSQAAPVRSPFYVFQISDGLIFTDTTKAFLSKYPDYIAPN